MRCTLVTSQPYFVDSTPMAPDDQLLQRALCEQGIPTQVVPWEDPSYDWSRSTLTVLRSTWNYYEDTPAFFAWAYRIAQHTSLLNPLEVVLWNANKQVYLQALAHLGVPIIPTLWLPKGTYELEPLVRQTGWQTMVMKPCISNNSHKARLLTRDTLNLGELAIAKQAMMLQPYLESVSHGRDGEHSHVFIEGRWSHAFKRQPFRTWEIDDPSDEPQVMPTKQERDVAHFVMRHVEQVLHLQKPLLFGRIDLVRDEQGDYRIMEVEVLEPMLHLEYGTALRELTRAITHRLHAVTAANALFLPAPLAS
jgi:hypothetical protein